MLNVLIRGQLSGPETDDDKIQHFEDVDETTKRLVLRCATVDWLRDVSPGPEESPQMQTSSPEEEAATFIPRPLEKSQTSSTASSDRETVSPTDPSQYRHGPWDDTRHHHRKPSAIKRLGMHLEPASSSNLSVKEVASQHEKPGVITPSRTDLPPGTEFIHPAAASTLKSKPKIKPEPPKSRRWRGRRNTNPEGENVNKIPEDSPITRPPTPTTPLPMTTAVTATRSEDRRNSANSESSSVSSSSLAPPVVPAHVRRSASNPPPAVPPPRRSTAVHAHPSNENLRNDNNPNTQQHGKYGQKPEPPRTRRWRAQTQSHQQEPKKDQGQPEIADSTVSVEEAVQNVSLE